jgi:two-component system phosphate regulon response regulator PhoB
VHSRSQVLDRVWGDRVFVEDRTVDVHIRRLREKLPVLNQSIETVKQFGYKLV